ncbi:MAG: phosphohydrolase, partial [Cyanobacteriota bacterium]
DMVLDARRDAGMWSKFNAGLEGSAWYLLHLHQTFSHRLNGSRSVVLLGESVEEILSSEAYRAVVPKGIAPAVWAAGYVERQEEATGSKAG